MTEPWIFVGALAVAYLMPGPDMALVLQTGIAQGRGPAMAIAIGLALARAAHVALAGLGLAALLAPSPGLFAALRVVGAAYLVWLGIGVLRAEPVPSSGDAPSPVSWWGAVRRGLLTNITNPKALLFCSVLLPHFARPEQRGGGFLLLGTILVGVGLVFDGLYALGGAALGRCLGRSPGWERLRRGLFGALLIGFGLRLALASA